jgi:hypothetical protein
MKTATNANQQASKRTRFAPPEVKDNDTPTSIQPPKSLAESFIRSHIASLHPEIQTIIERFGKEHLVLLNKVDHKRSQVQHMVDDDDFIPSSARVSFEITTSKLVKETPE